MAVSKGGRKGRVSNELVAASFAAILSVYAAGYWRTREDARRLESQGQVRRPLPAPQAAAGQLLPAMPDVAVADPGAGAGVAAAPVAASAASPGAPSAAPSLPVQAADQPRLAPVQVARSAAAAVQAPDALPASRGESGPAPQVSAAAAEPPVQVEATAEVAPPEVVWHDGYYTGWGQSFHGDIEARVTIKEGRIVEAGIATCATRYPCYVIDNILNQPVVRQSPEVDRVSRATESTDAYYYGLVEALKKAEAGPAAPAPSP